MTDSTKENKPSPNTKKDKSKPPQPTKKRREKKTLPPVSYLLTYGADEDEPKTFLESLVLPMLLLVVFVVSLALFHWGTNGFRGGNQGKGIDGWSYRQRHGNTGGMGTNDGRSFKEKFAKNVEL